MFSITQDEKEILEKIKALFGTKHSGGVTTDRSTHVFSVAGREGKQLLIDYIDKFPLKTKKQVAFLK
jgi:hypothetical protein